MFSQLLLLFSLGATKLFFLRIRAACHHLSGRRHTLGTKINTNLVNVWVECLNYRTALLDSWLFDCLLSQRFSLVVVVERREIRKTWTGKWLMVCNVPHILRSVPHLSLAWVRLSGAGLFTNKRKATLTLTKICLLYKTVVNQTSLRKNDYFDYHKSLHLLFKIKNNKK